MVVLQDYSICFRFFCQEVKYTFLMSYWSMEIYWTYANEKKINLYVKLQDQYVQPDQSGFIDQARDRHHAFTFIQFVFILILISVMI